MELTGVGSGIMIGIAALLWLAYLVPSWLRRREFDATERNAVRLQQTLRVMAETAEMPRSVRAEATARSVAEQERLMRIERRRRDQAAKLEMRQARAARPKPVRQSRAIAAPAAPTAVRAMRVRRARILFSVLGLAGIAGLVIALVSVFGGAATGWIGVGVSLIVTFTAWGMLGRLAPARQVARPVAAHPVAPRVVDYSPSYAAEPEAPAVREWTPVPLPRPLYLSTEQVQRAAAAPPADSDVADSPTVALARAALEAEEALRSAQAEATPISSSSRFASMGRLDDAELGSTDIDQVLARRRAAG